ncbi:MAG: hypothetical protein ACK5GN_00565 [Pseudomonadota bacterium]
MPVKLARLLLYITIVCCFDSHPRIDSVFQKPGLRYGLLENAIGRILHKRAMFGLTSARMHLQILQAQRRNLEPTVCVGTMGPTLKTLGDKETGQGRPVSANFSRRA